jgi:methionyl-tRNA formyltransferase
MKRIAFLAYREWSFLILEKILNHINLLKYKIIIITTAYDSKFYFKRFKKIKIYKINPKNNKKIEEIFKKNNISLALFYGWSWIVPSNIIKKYLCLSLHPSKLPKYKGGSPLQHQIIRNEKKSAVTIFKMNNKIDSGDIYAQKNMSLKGSLNNILNRIVTVSSIMTRKLIIDYCNDRLFFLKQKRNSHKIFKRRKPQDSEFNIMNVKNYNYTYFYNFIRMLDNPYPNAFCRIGNKKLYITKVSKIKKINNKKIFLINDTMKNNKQYFIKLKDSYAKILEWKLIG